MFISVDLGSTNVKAALYDDNLQCLCMQSATVEYIRNGGFVEFDALKYASSITAILQKLTKGTLCDVRSITFTGQAETLIVLDDKGDPLMNAISWMDERSEFECELIEKHFSKTDYYSHTGQLAVLPTWPATKILWLKHNRPDVFSAATHYVLLKDYIIFKLTGKLLADCSIATFTFYYDIFNKAYWGDMLDFIGISESQLPELIEPCTTIGTLNKDACAATGLSCNTTVNIGTLDHFAGMVGTGNVSTGCVSLSTGTVMALSIMASPPVRKDTGIAMHYGFIPDTYVMLPVAESGGVSLEWFKRSCLDTVPYAQLDAELLRREPSEIVFLPYITGTNAPEFDREACGVFWGLRHKYDAYDMALSVMEGVAHLLKKNCDYIIESGTMIERIIATGGAAKSSVWCQMKADITGIPIHIPAQKEAACLGAAMIGAISSGIFKSYIDASNSVVRMEHCFMPAANAKYERKHSRFIKLYDAMLEIAHNS